MDTTAKTFIGGNDNKEFAFGWVLSAGLFVDLWMKARSVIGKRTHACDNSTVIGETVLFAVVQSSLSFRKLRGRNHFHGLSNEFEYKGPLISTKV